MSYTVETAADGTTQHRVYGQVGSTAHHNGESWKGCKAGWYAHCADGADLLGPFKTEEAAHTALLRWSEQTG